MLLTILAALIAFPLLLYLPGMLLSRVLLPCTDALECHYERVAISALLSGWLALLLASFGVFSLWLHLLLLLLLCGALAWWARQRGGAPARPQANRWEVAGFALVGLAALLLVLPPFEGVLGSRDAGVYANAGFAIARTGGIVQYDPLLAELGQQAQSDDPAVRGPAEQALTHFFGVQHPERFIATRLYTAGFFVHEGDAPQGRIVPQHLHLFSSWVGLLTSVLGMRGGLFAAGLLGVLGAWSVGMLGRRLAGGYVGLVAFLLLALNSVQVWFARYPTSETAAQFLTFAALYFFARFHQSLPQQAAPQQATGTARSATLVYAALAGVAAGQIALARIDFFLVVGPLLLYLLYCAVSRRWQREQTALALGLGAMLLHTGLHIIFIARAYFFDTAFARLQDYAITSYAAQPFITPLLREVYHTTVRSPFKDPMQLWRELALLALGVAVLLVLWRWQQPLRFAETWLRRGRGVLLAGMAAGIVLLAGYAYFIRPQILSPAVVAAAPSCLLPQHWQASTPMAQPDAAPTREVSRSSGVISATGVLSATGTQQPDEAASNPCLTLQGYVGAPIDIPPPPPGLDEKYMIPLANFVRFGWYLSPLGVVLGVAGFALWWWRGLNRASWLFLVVGLLGTLFFVRDTYGTSDQSYIYILRRFVPVAYPTFSLSIAYVLVALGGATWAGGRDRWAALLRRGLPVVSAALLLLLVLFFLWTGRTIYRHIEYQGALQELDDVAAQFAPEDVLLLRGGAPTYGQFRDIPDMVATPLRFGFDRNALIIKSSNPGAYADALAAQIRHWQAAGREVYLVLSASGGDALLPGFVLEPAGAFSLRLPEFEQLTDQKPSNVAQLNLSFAAYRVLEERQPGQLATLEPPLYAYDFAAQVEGFYLPEHEPDERLPYAWTNGDALLRLPWQQDNLPPVLELRVAGGERPAHLGAAHLCLALVPESGAWTGSAAMAQYVEEQSTSLGCFNIRNEMDTYRVALDPQLVPDSDTGSLLLRLESAAWVPAEQSPERHDTRPVGVQFAEIKAGHDQ